LRATAGTCGAWAYQVLDDLEEFLGLDQGKSSQKTSVTLPRIYSSLPAADAPCNRCIEAIEGHSAAAMAALSRAAGREDMKLRLAAIVDEMTRRGLMRCKLQKSLC